jgi:hypothetical protein
LSGSLFVMVADLFRSRAALEAEIWTLRQQINVLRRTAPKKQTFSAIDRLIFVCLYRLRPFAMRWRLSSRRASLRNPVDLQWSVLIGDPQMLRIGGVANEQQAVAQVK